MIVKRACNGGSDNDVCQQNYLNKYHKVNRQTLLIAKMLKAIRLWIFKYLSIV